MRQRLLKYLKRLVIVLVALAAIGVGVFTWLFHWPFEGDVENILTLVPEDVEFVLRCDIQDLRDTGWVQENVRDDPIYPEIDVAFRKALEQLELELQTIQTQVDRESPVSVDVASFVGDNIVAGEVCFAGNFWEHASPGNSPPQWKDLVVLKRVRGLARCISGLQHGFIRRQIQPGPGVELSVVEEGIYEFHLTRLKPLAPGQVAGPDMSRWYVTRVLDVVAVSNNKRLIQNIVGLGADDSGARSFARRPGFDIPLVPGRVSAAVNLEALQNYFLRALDHYPDLGTLRRFLPPEALVKLSGGISFSGADFVEAGGTITYLPTSQDASDVARNVYGLPQRPVSDGIARFVPAADTFAVISLRANPEYLLDKIVKAALPDSDRKLWEDNLRKNPDSGFTTLADFFQDLSTRMGNEAMVALGRMSERYDTLDFTEWFSAEPAPLPALAIMVRLGEGARQEELEAYLSEKVFLLGMEKELARVTYGNFAYSRAELRVKPLNYKYIQPCFTVVNDHLVLTTTEGYMRRILDTVRDGESGALSQDETFRVTMGALPSTAHVGIFLDIEKLTRVPPSFRLDESNPANNDLGAPGTRGFLWDRRNGWVITERDDRAEAIRVRRAESLKFPNPMNDQHRIELERRVDAHMDGWLERYPEFLEEYRQSLDRLRRLRGLGLVLGATGGEIDARAALVLRKRDR
ncbi:MAG: hypothetical protein O2894_08405 [Planctomycetota bacterium]|nr:hypothetical protein [Planctomycetota bacterium]